MISGEIIHCSNIRQIFHYHVPHKILFPEKLVHHVMLLFFLFRDEKLLLSGCPPLYQGKLQEQGVQDVVNRNEIKFQSYGNLVLQSFSQFNSI